jgi:hypothetical protein
MLAAMLNRPDTLGEVDTFRLTVLIVLPADAALEVK